MFRTFFIWLSKALWAQRIITHWRFAWRAASRFVAGETAEEAIRAVRILNGDGILATLDFLGEHTFRTQDAQEAASKLQQLIEMIAESGIHTNVSIKLSQLGILLDRNLCLENLQKVLERARSVGNFVRIDMEDSSLTEQTIEAITWARRRGFFNIGTVLQAYLYRSEGDLKEMLKEHIPIRLVKGAYKEPVEVAFPRKDQVDANFDRLVDMALDELHLQGPTATSASARIPPLLAIATHDRGRIDHAIEKASQLDLARGKFEFQMLYGIRRDLQAELARAGYPVRVYVPFGTHWYPYFMRRLAERPENAWFFLSHLFRR